MFLKRKNMFDYINEAEDDETSEDAGTEDTGGGDTSEGETKDTGDESSDEGGDDDFNIDAEMDEEDSGEGGEEGEEGTEEDSGDDFGGDSSTEGDGEPIDANTKIFASLTAEEQAMKIKELKRLFKDLYTSCDDIIARINDIDVEEDTMDIISRVSMTMYSVKQYMKDYITNTFNTKSYIENDFAFNRFLSALNSVASVIESIAKIRETKLKKTENNK